MSKIDEDLHERFRQLVGDHGRSVERLLMRLERDPATREDLWSEVFVIAYVRFDQLQGLNEDEARGWLLSTTRFLTANTARRAMTRARTTARLRADEPGPAPSAEDVYFEATSVATEDQREAIKAAWSSLSAPQREVLALEAAGHDGPAIARQLGISALAARSRLLRARRAFVQACQRWSEVR